MTIAANHPLIRVEGLGKNFHTRHGIVRAIHDVSFHVGVGETVAVIGESGCGKSTLAMTLLDLVPASAGRISFDGEELGEISSVMKGRLGREISIVFQNPHSSLNPKMKVRSIIGEALTTALGLRGKELTERVIALLRDVGLGPEHLWRYPHEFSGGQRQRIAIARALALEPRLLILDEPTAALDVSVQAQILKLLKSLQRKRNISYLFITHNLGAADYLADRVIVMYLGKAIESGRVAKVFAAPRHPYTRALLDSVQSLDPRRRGKIKTLRGEIPSPLNRPKGCAFAPRCDRASAECVRSEPVTQSSGDDRFVACFYPLDNGI